MDILSPSYTTNSLVTTSLTPVFGDNVQDLLGTGVLHVNPSAIITVNSIDDAVPSIPGVITLRDAINQADTDTGEDLIVFDRSLFSSEQTITLKLGELDITHNLDIIAPRDSLTGGDLVTVSGNNAARVFEIEDGASAYLDGLIVESGNVTNENGGGIKNSGVLGLDNSIIRGDSATKLSGGNGGGNGGGIYNSGTATVSNSTISGNSAIDRGDGIFNIGTMTVSNSTLISNSPSKAIALGGHIIYSSTADFGDNWVSSPISGGGIHNIGIMTVSNSTISGNSADNGGGIANYNSATLTVSNSTISGNSATARGSGGGIDNNGTLTVSNSTISGNWANRVGGGIHNFGTSTVSNSTISSNTAQSKGGGIYNDYTGTATLLFSTMTQNQAANGGGVYQDDVPYSSTSRPGSSKVRNTIIASNLHSESGINPDISGTFISNGYNLIGDSTGSTGFDATGDIVGTLRNPIDPRLAPLDFYGGSTQNFALLPDSPAIDAADPTVLSTDPTTDQRGFPRRAADGRTDIGAYQFSS